MDEQRARLRALDLAISAGVCMNLASVLPTTVAKALETYEPLEGREVLARWRPIIMVAIAATMPTSVAYAKGCMRAMVRFAAWAELHGLTPTVAADLFQPANIDSFAANARKAATRAGRGLAEVDNQVSRLRQAGREVNPTAAWPSYATKGKGRDLLPPYSTREIAALRRAASSCLDSDQRTMFTLVLAAGFGAGLRASEIYALTLADISADRAGTVWVRVSTSAFKSPARRIPVAAPWDSDLLAIVSHLQTTCTPETRVMPFSSKGANGFNYQVRKLPRPKGCPPVVLLRMRTTWMVQRLAAGVWVPTLQKAAGVSTMHPILKAVSFLPAQDAANARLALTAAGGGL